MQTVKVVDRRNHVKVVDNITKVGSQYKVGQVGARQLLIGWLECLLDFGREVENQDWLINLDGLGTSLFQGLKNLNVDWEELIKKGDGVNSLVTVGLAKVEERDGTEKHRTGGNASLLGLEIFTDRLGVRAEGEALAVLESGLDVVVV